MSTECCICLDEIINLNLFKVKCYNCHNTFHNNCLRNWFKHNKSCPLCRKSTHLLCGLCYKKITFYFFLYKNKCLYCKSNFHISCINNWRKKYDYICPNCIIK